MVLGIYPRAFGSGRVSSPATDMAFPFSSGHHIGHLDASPFCFARGCSSLLL